MNGFHTLTEMSDRPSIFVQYRRITHQYIQYTVHIFHLPVDINWYKWWLVSIGRYMISFVLLVLLVVAILLSKFFAWYFCGSAKKSTHEISLSNFSVGYSLIWVTLSYSRRRKKVYMYMYNFNEIISQTNEGHIKRKTENSKVFWVTKFCSRVEIEILWRIRTCRCFKCYSEFMNLLLLSGATWKKKIDGWNFSQFILSHHSFFYQFFNIKFDKECDFCWCDHALFRRNWVFIKFFFHRCWI